MEKAGVSALGREVGSRALEAPRKRLSKSINLPGLQLVENESGFQALTE